MQRVITLHHVRALRRFHVSAQLPEALAPLEALAYNLRWAWHQPTYRLFAGLHPQKFAESGHNPVALLESLTPAELEVLANNSETVSQIARISQNLQEYLSAPTWFDEFSQKNAGPAGIAYFSAEYGITEVLPQYSGGLGILAGDHLKSASDLGVPIIGVGLFYRSGYFTQSLNHDGWQQETYPTLVPQKMPLSILREADGSPTIISMSLPGGEVLRALVRIAQVGRVPLLLLDTHVDGNSDAIRELTYRLYGGGGQQRLRQEMLLGIGGIRAVRAYCRINGLVDPETYHANEGHAGFLGVERISELVTQKGLTYEQALRVVRAGTVFTTHTPVPAGIDRFPIDLIDQHFGGAMEYPGVPLEKVRALGVENFASGHEAVFNMAVMGLRLAQRANGVSLLHGQVSRGMFGALWPGFDSHEVPITSITNGVHAPTWVDERGIRLASKFLGVSNDNYSETFSRVNEIHPSTIWETKRQMRTQLVMDARARVRVSSAQRGMTPTELGWTDEVLDPNVLTIGFARRVPTYKRLTLMLRDPERLKRLLLHPERPVQLVIAGKAHPDDHQGKALIQELVRFADDPEVRRRIVFLPNYDMAMARVLYPGCDVWLNNPLRPFEASGTSGMKAALNGALNLSILDGWWDEWYDEQSGWAIPTADGIDDPDRRDDLEAAALYSLIETRVAPAFYDRDEYGVPLRWVDMMKHTLATLGPKVLATRMVRDYTRRLYTPAAHALRVACHDDYAVAKQLAAYVERVTPAFPAARVDAIETPSLSAAAVGDSVNFAVYVSLPGINPEDVRIEVVHGAVDDDGVLTAVQTTTLEHAEALEAGRHRYFGEVMIGGAGAQGYAVRILPECNGLAHDAELGLVVNAGPEAAQFDLGS